MSHMPNKKPTDAKVVKSLMKYEEVFNVYLAAVRHSDSPHKGLDEDSLYESLAVARKYATAAQRRIDEKNLSKEEIDRG